MHLYINKRIPRQGGKLPEMFRTRSVSDFYLIFPPKDIQTHKQSPDQCVTKLNPDIHM